MIRTDLYEGQTCPSTGTAYTSLPHIGYYECFNPAGDSLKSCRRRGRRQARNHVGQARDS